MKRTGPRRCAALLSLLLLFLLPVAALPADTLEVHFIDVGQGASVLLRTDETAILVDAGNGNHAARYLEQVGVRRLDLVIATHGHADHIGGFPAVFDTVPVSEIWYNGQTHTTLTFERFIDTVLTSDARYREPRRGDRIELEELSITVLHPEGSAVDYRGHLHDKNIVVRADYREFSVVLTGDAETPVEQEILARPLPVAATALKLGHHGSRTSSSMEFLRAVNPKILVYQAGRNNRYGHPHPEVITRVRRLPGAQLYGTDLHGTIVITTDGYRWQVTSER